jgi:beta-glucosidase
MTLQEKIGQMNQINGRNPSIELYRQIRSGEVGSILNIGSVELVNELQKNSQEESKLGIPLLVHVMLFMGLKPCFLFPRTKPPFNPEMVN